MSRLAYPAFAALLLAAGVAAYSALEPDASSEAAAPKRVAAFPSPGTPVASNLTQISFRGIANRRAGPIRVHGSRSGAHSGRRLAHSDGRGFSFVPRRAFAAGETVHVRTGMRIVRGRAGDFSFRIGDVNGTAAGAPVKPTQGGRSPYRSRPDLAPPRITVTHPARGAAPGYVFIGPKSAGAAIVDDEGEPVWFRAMRSAGFGVQRYRGEPVLTWWQAPSRAGAFGRYVIADSRYRTIKRVGAGNGYSADLHEFRLTPRGSAYLTAYRFVRKDLRPVGGPRDGAVLDSIAQEVDLETGLVLWEWHSLGNVPLAHSHMPLPRGGGAAWDYFHVNSVADTADGNVLISGRNTHGVYKVSRTTGRTIWQLGGRGGDFRMAPGARFAWQHAAVPNADGTITLFDNSAIPFVKRPYRPYSRGITLELEGRRARLAASYVRPERLLARSQANTQVLPNGNALIGWGSEPFVTEFDREGRVAFELRFESHTGSYRAFRFPWVGRPGGRPAIATEGDGRRVRAWVSWNGATEVARWRLLSGPARGLLLPTDESRWQGFETLLAGQRNGDWVAVAALDERGREIGRTRVVRVGRSAR